MIYLDLYGGYCVSDVGGDSSDSPWRVDELHVQRRHNRRLTFIN